MLQKEWWRVEGNKLLVNTNTINTYKNLQMLQSPFSIHLCFPLGTGKPCFVSEMINRADPRTVRYSTSNKYLKFWATIVIQIFYILSVKSDQHSTFFESHSKHFCNHYLHVVKDSKELIIIQFSTNPRNSMQMTYIPCCLFISLTNLWRTKWESLQRTMNVKSQFFKNVFLN